MSTPPVLTPHQRELALKKASAFRKRRAEVKHAIKNGSMSVNEVLQLAATDDAVAKMRVKDFLEAISGVGKIRAAVLMEKLKISPTRRIQGLGKQQKSDLLNEFFKVNHLVRPGKLLVLSGPGGVGKSTVAKSIRHDDDFWVSVSATTRKPRPNEVEGRDYFFVTNETFEQMIENDEFLEWAEFAGNRYGTPKTRVEEALGAGKNVLLEIEIAGAKQVKAHKPDAVLVFLEPPSWEELVARLEGRGTDTPQRRAERLNLAQEELAAASFFDKVVVNDVVESVVKKLVELTS